MNQNRCQLNPDAAYNERVVLERIAAGDQTAFCRLFEAYRLQLFGFVFEMTKSAVDAEDIVQEIFVKIWVNRKRIAELDHARSYIYAMARNHTFDFLLKAAKNDQWIRQNWLNIQTDTINGETLLQDKECRQLIRHAIKLLPPIKQQVFSMSREEGMTHEQIAQQLGLSRSRVKNIMVELLRFLRDYLIRYSVQMALCWYCFRSSLPF